MGGIGKISREYLSRVLQSEKEVITPADTAAILRISRQEAGRLLSRWCQAGWLRRVNRGFYIPVPVEADAKHYPVENPWAVVSGIFEPGYIGGFSAFKHWDLTEQIFETVFFYSSRNIRNHQPVYSGWKARLFTVKPDKFFGLKNIWFGSNRVLISDPSRTLIDFLHDPAAAGGITVVSEFLESYLLSEHRNLELLFDYAGRMQNKTIFKRLGFLLEIQGFQDESFLVRLRKNISAGYTCLDPDLESPRIIRRWNLRIPESWSHKIDSKE